MGVTQGDSDFRSGSYRWTGRQFYNTKGEQIYFEYKNYSATGCDHTLSEARKKLVTKGERTDILMKLFDVIRKKREFPTAWKNCINTTNL